MSNKQIKSLDDYQRELNILDPRYVVDRVIGSGSYGIVLAGRDTLANKPELAKIAIKRVNKEIFEECILTKRILREIKLLDHFHDQNIIGLRNILTPMSDNFETFYIIMDLMETDLKQVVRSGQELTELHVQFFIYQALHALRVIHAAGVIHRDVTPANILVNTNCDLKICDFGLAKEEADANEDMTDYVTMRWYRAPELVMEDKSYTTQIDVWGLGCIMGELLGSRPLAQGRDRVSQLDKIVELIGTPTGAEILRIGSSAAQKYLRNKTPRPPIDFKVKFPNASSEALDLLRCMLTFSPDKRITVAKAMRHPYLAELYDETDENVDVPLFQFDEGKYNTVQHIKTAIYEVSVQFHRANPDTMPRGHLHLPVQMPPAIHQQRWGGLNDGSGSGEHFDSQQQQHSVRNKEDGGEKQLKYDGQVINENRNKENPSEDPVESGLVRGKVK